MPDIHHDFPINATPTEVFDAVTTPAGLDAWWTLQCEGEPHVGNCFVLDFGPGYEWRAVVSACVPAIEFELTLTQADADWTGSRVRFELEPSKSGTDVRFSHTGWPRHNAHFRTTCFCWAMYLRLLKRFVESDEVIPYERRLDA